MRWAESEQSADDPHGTFEEETLMTARRLPLMIAMFLMPVVAAAAPLTPEDAAKHIGETSTVCGVVASAHYADRSRAQPTFLNLGQPYPHAIFTAVIFGDDRAKFGEPERPEGKRICVSGTIKLYHGAPEIILHDLTQVEQQR
jgi:hypothetical protein